MPWQPYLGPVQRQVVEYVAAHPGATKAQVIRAIRANVNRTGYVPISRAYIAGYLRIEPGSRWGAQQLFVTEAGRQVLKEALSG